MVCELISRSGELQVPIKTIYFGGGTPSLLNQSELCLLTDTIAKHYDISSVIEVTLEANPEDISEHRLMEWKQLGINRLSIGVQSLKTVDLNWMNRSHNAADSLNAVLRAKEAGFENLSIDLIYGLPELTLQEWENHVLKAIELDVQHISSYCLTIEKNTALHSWMGKGKMNPVSEEVQVVQFKRLIELLVTNGYEHYEISNFAKPGYRAKHNSNYWKGVPYLGIGPSAHSFDGINRRWNISNNTLYMKMHEESWYDTECLTAINRRNELILNGLRISEGVDLEQLNNVHPSNEAFEAQLQTFQKLGWLIHDKNSIKLTLEGKLRADYISSELFMV